LVNIVTTKDICNEYSMKLGIFEKLCQPDPMVDVVEVRGLVVGMSPEPRALMTGTALYESIKQELLLYASSIAVSVSTRRHDELMLMSESEKYNENKQKKLHSYKKRREAQMQYYVGLTSIRCCESPDTSMPLGTGNATSCGNFPWWIYCGE
jgi:hypothetical protein